MAAVTVSFNGTRVNASDAATGWGNLGGGGPAPASEAQLRYQGTGAVNRKVTSTTARTGVQYDPGTGALDMTAAANRLLFFKGYVSDFGDVNTTYGCEIRIGSANNAYYDYNVAGSGANRAPYTAGYPAQGGYIIGSIDPNIAAWREGTTGSPSLTAVDYFGFAVQFVTGGAKSENVAFDAIDVGTGLTLTRGDGGDPDGTFADFISADEGNTSNRWGVVRSAAGIIYSYGKLTIGESGTATVFQDQSSVVVFPDGYVSAGLLGVTCDISNAGTDIDIGATIIGRGSSTTEDTRPDFVVTGTAGAFGFTGTLTNHRNVTFTSACLVDNAVIQCQLLTQSSSQIENSVIRTTSAANVACLQDPSFGSSTGVNNTEFEQAGSGHAIEVTGNATFTNITFTGYGADGTSSAAIFNDTGGAVTIDIVGGDTPTVRNGTGASTTINVSSQVTITVVDVSGTPIQNARVFLEYVVGGADIFDGSDGTSLTDVNGQVTASVNNSGAVTGRVRKSSSSPYYKTGIISGTISGDFSQTVVMIEDE